MARLTTYSVKLNGDRISELVKEYAINYDNTKIDTPRRAAEILQHVFDAGNLAQENFWVISLDGGRKVNGLFTVTTGTLLSSLVHPREVFQRAILCGAASIIIAHNHPSGNLEASEQDREVTKRIRQSGELLGIRLDDHIIIGGDEFASAA